LTRGSTRTVVDVALYAGVLASTAYLLFSDGDAVAGTAAGRLDTTILVVVPALLGALGLRDKVSTCRRAPSSTGCS